MTKLVLTEQQAAIVLSAGKSIEVADSTGKLVGYILPTFSEEEIAQAIRALESNQPRHTTEQVLDHLGSLESK